MNTLEIADTVVGAVDTARVGIDCILMIHSTIFWGSLRILAGGYVISGAVIAVMMIVGRIVDMMMMIVIGRAAELYYYLIFSTLLASLAIGTLKVEVVEEVVAVNLLSVWYYLAYLYFVLYL